MKKQQIAEALRSTSAITNGFFVLITPLSIMSIQGLGGSEFGMAIYVIGMFTVTISGLLNVLATIFPKPGLSAFARLLSTLNLLILAVGFVNVISIGGSQIFDNLAGVLMLSIAPISFLVWRYKYYEK